jgi:hypothetical protein
MKNQNSTQPPADHDLEDGLTELMKAHLDDVTGGLAARHSSWRQSV